MATCGYCKAEGQSIEHVKACAQEHNVKLAAPVKVSGLAKSYVEKKVSQSSDYKPMALSIPDSKYALYNGQGKIIFFEVRTGKGKWAGFQFLDRLVGAPGDWQHFPVKGAEKSEIMKDLDMNPKAAAIRFSKHFTVCAVCGSPLSDPESMAAGLGPICAKRF